MKFLLLILVLAVALALMVFVRPAEAHKSGYCGHTTKTWTVYSPYGAVKYRERLVDSWGAGPHYHEYQTQYWTGAFWAHVHYHLRQCPGHGV